MQRPKKLPRRRRAADAAADYARAIGSHGISPRIHGQLTRAKRSVSCGSYGHIAQTETRLARHQNLGRAAIEKFRALVVNYIPVAVSKQTVPTGFYSRTSLE